MSNSDSHVPELHTVFTKFMVPQLINLNIYVKDLDALSCCRSNTVSLLGGNNIVEQREETEHVLIYNFSDPT